MPQSFIYCHWFQLLSLILGCWYKNLFPPATYITAQPDSFSKNTQISSNISHSSSQYIIHLLEFGMFCQLRIWIHSAECSLFQTFSEYSNILWNVINKKKACEKEEKYLFRFTVSQSCELSLKRYLNRKCFNKSETSKKNEGICSSIP